MTCRLSSLLLLLVLLLASVISARHARRKSCPCKDESLCEPITEDRREVVGFVLNSTADTWTKYDWNKLTSIVLVDFYSPELYCLAHEHEVRVLFLNSFPGRLLTDLDERQVWLQKQLSYALSHHMDGINLDFEEEIEPDSLEMASLSDLVNETAVAFHEQIPGSQVTFDVPFSPINEKGFGVDGRNYDFKKLSLVCDFLFIMSYDHSSQIFSENDEECFAQANSNFFTSVGGIYAFLDLGIPANKLVFGQPWYGYDYECKRFRGGEAHKCWIEYEPFRGVNCSDAVGLQRSYSDIVANFLPRGTRYYDDHSKEYSITYKDAETNRTHLIWYDTSYSYRLKYQTIEMLGLRGVGVWHLNHLNYSRTGDVKELWDTLPAYTELSTHIFS